MQYQMNADFTDLTSESFAYESLVRTFTWAQWDPVHQTLYYIHNRKPSKCLVEGEEESPMKSGNKVLPTLSGLQFHDDLPHESVVIIANQFSYFLICIICTILVKYPFKSTSFISFRKLWRV